MLHYTLNSGPVSLFRSTRLKLFFHKILIIVRLCLLLSSNKFLSNLFYSFYFSETNDLYCTNLLWVKLPMKRGCKAWSRCWWIDVRETAISFLDYLELSFSPCENRCVMIKLCTVILWWLCNLVAPTNIIYCTIRLTANCRNHQHICFPSIDCRILNKKKRLLNSRSMLEHIWCPVPSSYVTSLHYFTKVQVQ